ncbi:CAP domain-containing protein [Micromonospora okii]|uniref:CAP domain-containing protein n=1 Tax=Micromonospora okii TaxID=1182970 RepID=UPI001E4BE30A|nr:CAP domain-containing protein [Micromonospora okii]
MYGWTDPNDPEGNHFRQDDPTDGPAWLSDRPEPRSAYLFGDAPDLPSDERHNGPTRPGSHGRPDTDDRAGRHEPPTTHERAGRHEPPTTHEQAGRHERAETYDRPDAHDRTETHARPNPYEPSWAEQPTARWRTDAEASRPAPEPWRPGAPAAGPHAWPEEPTLAIPVVGPAGGGQPVRLGGPAAEAPGDGEGRHRPRRRLPRPLLVGGAAAAATLVVSLGVGALALPGGDEPRTDPAAVDAPVAAAPADPGDALPPPSASPSATGSASPRPSASPASASASPSPRASRTVRSTPRPSRSTAASRGSQRSTAPTPKVVVAPGVSTQAAEVVNLVNAERAKAGCGALKINDKLMKAAQAHSQDQADNRKMSHTGSDGSDVGERLDRVGYAWRAYGENVAWNQQTPAAVMNAWMNSSGHRANILNCSFTQIGVGVATSNGPYWTQNFGTPR